MIAMFVTMVVLFVVGWAFALICAVIVGADAERRFLEHEDAKATKGAKREGHEAIGGEG
jgi:hypothetical protein